MIRGRRAGRVQWPVLCAGTGSAPACTSLLAAVIHRVTLLPAPFIVHRRYYIMSRGHFLKPTIKKFEIMQPFICYDLKDCIQLLNIIFQLSVLSQPGFRVLKTLLSINADDGNYVIVKACITIHLTRNPQKCDLPCDVVLWEFLAVAEIQNSRAQLFLAGRRGAGDSWARADTGRG